LNDPDKEKVNTLAVSLRTLLRQGLTSVHLERGGAEQVSVNERNSRLAKQFESCRQYFQFSVDDKITQAIQDLIDLVKKHEVTIPHRNHSSPVFNRASILEHVCRVFDPALQEIVPVDSHAWNTLSELGTPLPLSSHLNSSKNLLLLANNLKKSVQVLEDSFEPRTDDWEIMVKRGESLIAVAEILDEIRFSLPVISLRWCEACFRRRRQDRKYCGLHTAGQASGKDTANRKSKNLSKALPPATIVSWKIYRSIRRALGDSIELASYPEDIQESFLIHGGLLMVDPSLKTLVDVTLNLPWSWASPRWEYILRQDFPKIFALIGRGPSEFQDWDEFCTHLLVVLEDLLEESKHPYWLLHIMACAEDWLTSTESKIDGRQTTTKARILKLFERGVGDPKEIAKLVGTSKQYVYRVLKLTAGNL
jgi:hypothetical protein